MPTFTNMKKMYSEKIEIPAGIQCEIKDKTILCSKNGKQVSKSITTAAITLSVDGNTLVLTGKTDKKNYLKLIRSYSAHVRNLFAGLEKEFVYTLQACNVHFPMTLKQEKEQILINNFLGEKIPRVANILDGVELKIEGVKIKVISADIEKAGQTAANIEKASKVTGKDRRIFQDGIFITKKPEAEI